MGIKEIMSMEVDLSDVMIPARVYEQVNKIQLPANSIAMGASMATPMQQAVDYLSEIRRQQMELQKLADEIAERIDQQLDTQNG